MSHVMTSNLFSGMHELVSQSYELHFGKFGRFLLSVPCFMKLVSESEGIIVQRQKPAVRIDLVGRYCISNESVHLC
jgi:hypothetical protein